MGIVKHHIDIQKRPFESKKKRINKSIGRFQKSLTELKNNPYSRNYGYIFNNFYQFIAESQTLGHPRNEVFTFLYYAHQLGIAMFKLAANPGKEVTVRFGNTDVSAIGKENKDLHPYLFEQIFRLNQIIRDKEGYEILQGISNELMLKVRVTVDSFDVAKIQFYKSLSEKSLRNNSLQKVLQETENPKYVETGFVAGNVSETIVTKERKEIIQYIQKPVFEAYKLIFENDQKGLNTFIFDYLNSYRDFIEKKGYTTDGSFWLAYGLLAALAFAHDQGMRIDVESDYIPAWLYKGEFEGLKQQLVC